MSELLEGKRSMSIIACLVLASVLSCATSSSTEPAAYISHLGSNLTNNSYIPFQNIRRHNTSSGSKGVECHTDLTTCCNGSDGTAGGNWSFDNGITVGYRKHVFKKIYTKSCSLSVIACSAFSLRHLHMCDTCTIQYINQ